MLLIGLIIRSPAIPVVIAMVALCGAVVWSVTSENARKRVLGVKEAMGRLGEPIAAGDLLVRLQRSLEYGRYFRGATLASLAPIMRRLQRAGDLVAEAGDDGVLRWRRATIADKRRAA